MQTTWVQRIDGFRAQRLRHEWSDMLPVVLRSVVHGRMSVGRFRQPWSTRPILIKWVIAGEASIGIGGRRLNFGPEEVAIYTPTQQHQFWNLIPDTEMCWFSIDGPLAEQFVHHMGLRAGVYQYGPAPIEHILELYRSLDDQTFAGCRKSSLLAVRMLYTLAEKLPQPQTVSVVQKVRHLIREGLADPNLSAQQLADKLSYNRGALSRLFHQHSGSTIIDCMTQTRLQEAEMLLTHTEDRISDVARKCGFSDVSYFTRWMKKHTGKLPKEVRVANDKPTTQTAPPPLPDETVQVKSQ